MRLSPFLIALALLPACGRDSLLERVNDLEEKVSDLEAKVETLEEERVDLQRRIGQIPITEENRTELAEIRAKLASPDLTQREIDLLRDRISRLEDQAPRWASVIAQLQTGVYAVLHVSSKYVDGERDEDARQLIYRVGTAFAINSRELITNAHVNRAIDRYDAEAEAFAEKWNIDVRPGCVVIRNLTTTLKRDSNYYWIEDHVSHEDYRSWDYDSPDVGLVVVGGTIPYIHRMRLIPQSEAWDIRMGDPIATIGFPGEITILGDGEGWDLVASFKNGTVSSVRGFIIQHNLELTRGTSGSPIINPEGEVVAINSSGYPYQEIGFGVRADKVYDLIRHRPLPPHKPVASSKPDFDGLDVQSLPIQGEAPKSITQALEETFLPDL